MNEKIKPTGFESVVINEYMLDENNKPYIEFEDGTQIHSDGRITSSILSQEEVDLEVEKSKIKVPGSGYHGIVAMLKATEKLKIPIDEIKNIW